jgi:hypothetical protein
LLRLTQLSQRRLSRAAALRTHSSHPEEIRLRQIELEKGIAEKGKAIH